jgi:molybdopterin-guanine dinucleotide biosynthesis protein A
MVLRRVSGAVLNGGRSSRFGTDKARFVWQGRALLEHSVAALSGCAEVFIVGGSSTLPGVALYPDEEPFQGSLHGLLQALEVARCEHIAVTACDMPRLSSAYWSWLCAHLEPDVDVLLPLNSSAHLEPLAGIYSRRCLGAIQSSLECGERRMTGWWQGTALKVRTLEWQEIEARFGADVFLNANTPDDLEPPSP